MTEAPSTTAVRDVVLGMWQAITRRDWDAIKTFLSADCLYVDMPIPALAARGPDDVVKMLKVLLKPLPDYERDDGKLVCDGSDAMLEHAETWTFPSGERGTLKIVSVHKVVDGKVTVCKNYWDMATLMSFAPANYFEGFGIGDTSWVFDATGLV